IDTGSEMTMGNLALEARVFRGRHPPPAVSITLVSVTGQTITARLATLHHVKVGGFTLDNVAVAFADAPPFALFGLDRQPAMLFGTDLLEAFRRVSLDFRNRRVRFVLRR
ncbi:MAG: aspartyl protease family protein, partial [Janthinobacterium lividum]